MTKLNRVYRLVVYAFLITLIINTSISNASTNEILDVTHVIQDVNGVGVVLSEDISSYIDGSSFVYVLIGLSQGSSLNGLYVAGFGPNENSNVLYILGNPFNPSIGSFNDNNALMKNFGSVIYVDILDYLVAFGSPDEVKSLVVSLPISFDEISVNIPNILADYQNYFVPAQKTQTETTNTTQITDSTTNNNSSSNENPLSNVSGFEAPLLLLMLVIPIFFRRLKE